MRPLSAAGGGPPRGAGDWQVPRPAPGKTLAARQTTALNTGTRRPSSRHTAAPRPQQLSDAIAGS
eukprot:12571780-Alexandrium_andersonii.AAC.1